KFKDTNRGQGDGLLNFDTITIDSNFRLIDIDGTIDQLEIDGFLGSLIADSFSNVDISGTVGKIIVNDQLVNADISVGQLTRFTARDNIIDSTLTTTAGQLRTVSLLGQESDLDIVSAGTINNITARGNFTGNITAADSLGTVSARGSITAASWNITSASDSATVNKIFAQKGIDIDNVLVEGMIKTFTAGSNRYRNGLAGNVTAESIRSIRVYGDLDSVIRANSSLNKWSVTGDISVDSHIYVADIDLLQ
ncbi:MAG: hypothetical protein JXM68_05085, partial [Sedimentisphaerales bacterium]|nr:hypothetical protein [Sedimentisphaerales bacterium]